MLSRLAYTIVGIVIVALSFGAMMFTLNLWSGYPIANAVSAAGMRPAPQLKSVSVSYTHLRIVATPQDGFHTLAGQFNGLNKNQVYRVMAWVRCV